MDYDFVADNVKMIEERIVKAALSAGRRPEAVELLAVSKFHPVEAVLAAYKAGVRHFGENRVQEALQKYGSGAREALPGASLAMIGTLQSNKAGKAARFFDAVQSVDSSELLLSLAKKSVGRSRPLKILLELHTGEESKSGFPDLDSIFMALDALFAAEGKIENGAESVVGSEAESIKVAAYPVDLCGLMTMAPNTDDEAAIRKSFQILFRAREVIAGRYHMPRFQELSMGMSNDFEIAIQEGATCVRIGTALFGARQ